MRSYTPSFAHRIDYSRVVHSLLCLACLVLPVPEESEATSTTSNNKSDEKAVGMSSFFSFEYIRTNKTFTN